MATQPMDLDLAERQESPDGQAQPARSTGQQNFGPNNERLEEFKPEVVGALRQLATLYKQEGIVGRRNEIRRIRQARLFWQGMQYGWFDPVAMLWRQPFGTSGLSPQTGAGEEQDFGRYQFVTNIYQAFALAFISVLSQDVPTVRFYPNSVNKEEDVTTAKAASDVAELVEQNNHVSELFTLIAYYLWTDGKIGAFVRYVTDGERFGFTEKDELSEGFSPMGQDSYVCPECGMETMPRVAEQEASPNCPQCGTPLTEDHFRPAELLTVPRVTGTKKFPNGQEVISIVGGLELNTPVWASEFEEFPYLQWQMETHRAKLQSAYPHAAEKIATSGVHGSSDDTYARISRLTIRQGLPIFSPTDGLHNLITFQRTWIRPWAYYQIQDADLRKEVQELFPDGCYIAFAGEVYCESRNEAMGDYWRVLHAFPGDGQSRPSVGDSLIPIQERVNTLENIVQENCEFGVPPIYADPQVLDFDALGSQRAEPAAHYPARAMPGQPLAAGFYQPSPAQLPAELLKHLQELSGPVAQFLTGMFPAVYGGQMHDIKTATAYAQARDQALGRIGLVWRRLKQFYADTMLLSVDCFRKNRPDDAEMPFLGEGGQFESKMIRLADLKGNVQARPEADETYPRTKAQQRSTIEQLMGAKDEMIAKVLSDPSNLGFIKNVIGLSELVIPDEDSRIKQMREIQILLQGQPVPSAPVGGPEGMPPGPELSSVPVDELLDNHAVEYNECKRWASSDAGQEARIQNPAGFANVKAHAMQHFAMLQQQMMMNAPGSPQ